MTTSAADKLRTLLDQPGVISFPCCCYDALSARLIERAGFSLTFMSGFAVQSYCFQTSPMKRTHGTSIW